MSGGSTSSPFSACLGGLNHGLLDRQDGLYRPQMVISGRSSSKIHLNSFTLSRREKRSLARLCRRFGGSRSGSSGSGTRKISRGLLTPLLSPEEERGLEACYRSHIPEQVHKENKTKNSRWKHSQLFKGQYCREIGSPQ